MVSAASEVHDGIDDLLGRVADQFLQQLAAGEQPDVEEYARQHPEIAGLIREIFPAINHVRNSSGGSARPDLDPEAIGTEQNRELGDFRIVREIGRGGMGVVYEAEQLSMGRRVALKVLPFASLIDENALQRFRNEVRAVATLNHPHITAVHSVGEERGVHYYAMQLIRGQSLAAVLRELASMRRTSALSGSALSDALVSLKETESEKAVPTVDAAGPIAVEVRRRSSSKPTGANPAYCQAVARLGVQAADALQHAHENGIVHRDIKPGNLLLDSVGKLWVTDFGLARLESDASVTMTGDIVGTLRYMSPEQTLTRRGVVDHRTDIYSLGATLYELLTLKPVFETDDRAELLQKIASREPRPPRQFDAGVPRELETIILKALSKDPDERYDSAQEMANDLQAYLEDRPIQAKPPTLLQRVAKWSQRHKSLVAATAAILLLSTAGLAVSNLLIAQERDETEVQRQQAERSYQRAREIVDRLVTEVTENEQLAAPELLPLRKDLLELALRYYQEFISERGDDPELQTELAAAYFRVGNITWRISSIEEALEAHLNALAIREELVSQHPANVDYRNQLAISKSWVGYMRSRTGQTDEALALLREAIEIQEGLAEQAPDLPGLQASLAKSHNNLAWLLATCADEGVRDAERAVELAEKAVGPVIGTPHEGYYRNTLGVACYRAGDFHRAIDQLERSREVSNQQNDSFHTFFLAMAHWKLGARDEACEYFESAVGWMEEHLPDNEELGRFRGEAESLLDLSSRQRVDGGD